MLKTCIWYDAHSLCTSVDIRGSRAQWGFKQEWVLPLAADEKTQSSSSHCPHADLEKCTSENGHKTVLLYDNIKSICPAWYISCEVLDFRSEKQTKGRRLPGARTRRNMSRPRVVLRDEDTSQERRPDNVTDWKAVRVMPVGTACSRPPDDSTQECRWKPAAFNTFQVHWITIS